MTIQMVEKLDSEQWWEALGRSLPAGAEPVIVWRTSSIPGGGDTDDVPVEPATEEERADELAEPDVAKGLNS
jgi:hypothetical protein